MSKAYLARERMLLSGDQAVALAALHAGVALAAGYPGTPSTEILEALSVLGGPAQWAPNEKVALEVCMGAAYGGARALCTMKHVGVNVAADPLFTVAYTGVSGALVLISADDPGMASSQNEQDNRRYAVAAALPMLEPADSQEAYDYTLAAFELSQRWGIPTILRMTTRVCHGKSVVVPGGPTSEPPQPGFVRDIAGRVMIPAHARPAHRRLRAKLAEITAFGETSDLNQVVGEGTALGIVTSGICYQHVREAAPEAKVLKLGLSYPLPEQRIREFAASVDRCVVIEEGDPVLADALAAMGLQVEGKAEMYRFGELNVARVRRIIARDESPEPVPARGKPPQLCDGCPYRRVFETLTRLDCIVSGDIGCYTLGALPPLSGMDSQSCMGASLGVGLGLRHVLPEAEAKRVVSIIGDSTFVHSGITGLVEMAYNRPATGHVLIILDNGTTAMTGQQEHPGTGRLLDHEPTHKLDFPALCRAIGIDDVTTIDAAADPEGFERLLVEALGDGRLHVLIAKRPCLLAAKRIREYERRAERQDGALEVCGNE
ncbi:MAG: thiamine pyrophosphate-binding protein [Armatimonadetes bacterium]|nr:thiamine pyrophosphate-binding protein [Armatimonadota bacterium]